MLKQNVKQFLDKFFCPVPEHLESNQIRIDDKALRTISESIKVNFHTGWRSESTYSPGAYQRDFNNHLFQRLETDRQIVIPWLDEAIGIQGKRILEVGCGTGSSTVALAEQGAKITAIDIDEGALAVARDRCRVYGLDVRFMAISADTIHETFGSQSFDAIIYYACLEHMTIPERIKSLHESWLILPPGGTMAVIETPNRLWYFDGHTSMLPFFHWLPTELAYQYSSFSPREHFRDLYVGNNAESEMHFLRRGRGVSFHEFDIAIAPVKDLFITSSLSTYQGIHYRLQHRGTEHKYKTMLRTIYPDIHEGFFDQSLDLVLRKSSS